ncbi:alpha/beta fold hydrolase (plasmid) [Rhizobium grahamii]|uniref:Alpha/beta fold hydrolase n=1 Tax=Rhizobium grahamii TaxID=1120045 RepID=A0A5Q0CFX4_9HYPH|nr:MULTISPECIES: alpha/beta fold hydrolase [Rhizobium]QFY63394.1 alpha/beta fold hydrolase [Rhizobium grahamii]QRM51841.1 alpha/beta fold hydrolase [Rhizobium sp. BG6]
MTRIRFIEPPKRRRASIRETLRLVVGYGLAALAMWAVFYNGPAKADDQFYHPDSGELAGRPGSIIRSEPMPFAPEGASAFRILYRSLGLQGEPIAVSGILIKPDTGVDEGRPVVAWAHPTSGVATVCAPSLSRGVYRQIQGLEQMLQQGFAVVATDYPGLGGPGTHPYLIGDSEGRAVLDSVRAARELLDQRDQTRFSVWGHSQGGQAALYAGVMAGSYAPELKLVGIAAAAPATDLPTLMRDDFASSGGKGLTAFTLWSWSRVFDIDLGTIVKPDAVRTMDTLAGGCIETIFDLLERRIEERPLSKDFLTITDLGAAEPWDRILKQNVPGVLPRNIPVFVAQGLADGIVRPAVTVSYVRQLCTNGSEVDFVALPKVGHGFIARDTAPAAVQWMSGRFAGAAAPNTCAQQPKTVQGD